MRPMCIYHNNCNDGFGAALVLWKHFKGEIDFWRGSYNSDKLPIVRGRDVYIVDFSYPSEMMDKIQQESARVIWLDHHIGAIKNLDGFKWRDQDINGSTLDPMFSGVGLAWLHFNKAVPMPDLYKYIQDWDTWQFKFKDTRAVHFALHSYKQDFEIWNEFLQFDGLKKLMEDGHILLRAHDLKVEQYVRQAFIMEIDGHKVPVVNAPGEFASDVGNILSRTAPFAGVWFESEGHMNFSLRSQPDGADVSEICKKFGGGGHKNSAGFRIGKGRAPIDAPKPSYTRT